MKDLKTIIMRVLYKGSRAKGFRDSVFGCWAVRAASSGFRVLGWGLLL